MSAGALMSIGIKSLEASQAALQVTSHNIANANVKGYSRQKIELATSQGQYSGAGFFGKGVDVVAVKRVHSEYLTREANATSSQAKLDSTRLQLLEQIENVFKPGEFGIGQSIGNFLNSMVDLASRPADSATREVVLARAQEMALRFSSAGRQLDDVQRSLIGDLRSQITEVNQLAANIAQANDRIGQVSGYGHEPNDLLDERDRLIARLNDIVQVNTVKAADGSISVFLAGGHMLVLANETQPLQVVQDPEDPARPAIGYFDGNSQRVLDPNLVKGGSALGLLRFQATDLMDARNLLGRLAASVAGAVNEQQMLGVNLFQPIGSAPSEPMFSVGEPTSVPHGANLRNAGGLLVGDVTLQITDPGQLKPSDYDMVADTANPGQWTVTRKLDGAVFTVSDGDEIDGFRITLSGPPDAGDRFTLRPVSNAASAMRLLLDDTRDLAAASPLVATAIPSPTGTVSVDWLRMNSAPPLPDHTVRIRFTDDSGNYSWDLIDAGGNTVSTATGTWQPGTVIPSPPVDMNGFSMRLLGVPRLGDVVQVAPASAGNFTQNNGNAVALSALRDARIVDGQLATDAFAAAIADVGVRVQGARSTAKLTTALSEAASVQRDAESGVNLDEEAARLIQYQQAYQAAAKVLRTAQNVMDALLEASR